MTTKPDTAVQEVLPNNGYMHPMLCCSCLKVWVDNKPIREGEESINLFGHEVPIRWCPRCIHDGGHDWPGAPAPPR